MASALLTGISVIPKNPYLKQLTKYKIGLHNDTFLQNAVSWGVGIVVLLLSLGFWFMWWYLGKQSKS